MRALSYYRTIARFWTKKKVPPKFNIVKPGYVSKQKVIPPHINKPIYYENGIPAPGPVQPEIKSEEQIAKMRASCRLAANILKEVGERIGVGQTTDQVDCLVHDLVIKHDAYPSPLNYKLYPKSVCTSVNNVACHGIPDDRPLLEGDIVNVDITVFLDDYHGDCSKTFHIGKTDDQALALIQATDNCLQEGISVCQPGAQFCAIGKAIQKKAKQQGFGVVPYFIGHGIGHYFHGPPDIMHYRNRYPGLMQPGMTFTIEPILSEGATDIKILEDNWTAITIDDSRTAQSEHTVLITENGCEILTIPD